MTGAPINLTGTTIQGLPVNVNATTNAAGRYTFDNVLPGTYQITAGAAQNVLSSSTTVFSGLVITSNQTLTQNLPYRGLGPAGLSMRLFLSSTTVSDLPFPAPGTGTGFGNFRPNNLPIIETPIANVNVTQNAPEYGRRSRRLH